MSQKMSLIDRVIGKEKITNPTSPYTYNTQELDYSNKDIEKGYTFPYDDAEELSPPKTSTQIESKKVEMITKKIINSINNNISKYNDNENKIELSGGDKFTKFNLLKIMEDHVPEKIEMLEKKIAVLGEQLDRARYELKLFCDIDQVLVTHSEKRAVAITINSDKLEMED